MTKDEIKEISDLAGKSPDKVWIVHWPSGEIRNPENDSIFWANYDGELNFNHPSDRKYISLANPKNVLFLLDTIDRLKMQNEELTKENKEMLDALLDIANGHRDFEVERARQALKEVEGLSHSNTKN